MTETVDPPKVPAGPYDDLIPAEFTLTVDLPGVAVPCRISRQSGTRDSVLPAWVVTVSGAAGVQTAIPDRRLRNTGRAFAATKCAFLFAADDVTGEAEALAAAREYAIEAAHAVVGHRDTLLQAHVSVLQTLAAARGNHRGVPQVDDYTPDDDEAKVTMNGDVAAAD